MKGLNSLCFMCLVAAWCMVLASNAGAVSAPGLNFTMEFKPALISLPESLKETDPALYQAHLSLSQPKSTTDIDREKDEATAKVNADTKLPEAKKKEKLAAIQEEWNSKKRAIEAEAEELRVGFFTLAEERLSRAADPYILLFYAQQLYAVRHMTPEALQQAAEALRKAAEEKAAKAAAEAEKAAKKKKPAKTAKMEPAPAPTPEPKPVTGTPSRLAGAKFATNLERIVAACEELRERYASFAHLDQALLLLAAIKWELNLREEAVTLWKDFLGKKTAGSTRGEILARLAEYEFDTPKSYDHFSNAVGYYQQALKFFPNGPMHFRLLYKLAWAQYLSPDMSEDAVATFTQLYREIKNIENPGDELLSIQIESVEVLKQIKAHGGDSSSYGQ